MERIYLDNASTSFPKAPGVAEAVYHYISDCGCNINRGGYGEAYQAEELVLETRQRTELPQRSGRIRAHCRAWP